MAKRIYTTCLRVLETICVVLLAGILLCMVIQISCRLLGVGQSFTEELARILYCLLVFIGSPLALAEGAHIVVDMIAGKSGPLGQRIFDILDGVAVDVFSVFALKGMLTLLGTNTRTTAVSMTWLRMNWVYGIIAVSFVLLFAVSTIQIVLAAMGRSVTVDINADARRKAQEEDNAALSKAINGQLGGAE